jgi:phosphatidylglycerophosphate synthase
MNSSFWLKRLVFAFLVAGVMLFLVQMAKGYQPLPAVQFALIWGGVTAAVFTLVGYIRYKRNPACMLPPEKGE